MKEEIIFSSRSLYRDDFRIRGYRFGSGEKALCVVGSMRGNEFQQLYACSKLVKKLKTLEEEGRLVQGKEILVIPCVNPYSMNNKKRFWTIDNTDINRMFPGYSLGETTQRIAAGLFEKIKDFKNGIQFTSYYMPGHFVPHIRMMKTGYENVEMAKQFGMPYVMVRDTRPFDTTTLNYNWQIWETNAFSLYTTDTEVLDRDSAALAVEAILNYMSENGMIRYQGSKRYLSTVIYEERIATVRAPRAGFFNPKVKVGDNVVKDSILADIMDPYDGSCRCSITAPCDAEVFFMHSDAMTYANTAVFKLIRN